MFFLQSPLPFESRKQLDQRRLQQQRQRDHTVDSRGNLVLSTAIHTWQSRGDELLRVVHPLRLQVEVRDVDILRCSEVKNIKFLLIKLVN